MRWIENLKVGTRLLGAFIMIACIAATIGVQGIMNIDKMNQLDQELYTKMTEPLGVLLEMNNAYNDIRANSRNILLDAEGANLAEYEIAVQTASTTFDKNVEIFAKTLLTDEGEQVINTLKAEKSQYMQNINQVILLVKNGQIQQASSLLYGEGRQAAKEIEDVISHVSQMKLTLAKQSAENNKEIGSKASQTMLFLVGAGIIFSILLAFVIAKSISNPISQLIVSANKIAKGDLDVEIQDSRTDEIGMLAKAFAEMAFNMNQILGSVYQISYQVAAGAKQVSDSSIELSQGATEQASAVQQLTASIEEITAQTRLNAEHSSHANDLTSIAKKDALKGNNQMKQMLGSMQEINSSSMNISKIIKVIDEIAFQTNILALNAAVEAARAGQHGKGFAVVAEEVRNLAARSASAAKETTQMIEDSIKEVENGMKIATQTADALDSIVEGVTKVAGIMSEISIASNEQAIGIEQINQGVLQISDVVQTNSATSEESAAASEELSSQADLLSEQVSKFKLKR